ncbi:MAG: hypothetical protein AB1Z67_05005 [Candidatus Limnocylindrales bacterium]
MDILVAIFAGVIGAAMAGIWGRDIMSGHGFDAPHGLLRAREADSDDLMIWHWAAELGTALALIAGAFLIMINAALAEPIMLLALGALMYTSTNSLGWSLAAPERAPYVWPMAIGLIGAIIGATVLILF